MATDPSSAPEPDEARAGDTWLRTHPVAGLVLQTVLAGASVAIVFLLVTPLRHAVVASSLASSAFTVFLLPHAPFATERHVLGGHLVAIGPGLAAGLLHPLAPAPEALAYGAAVVAAGILMEVTATSHPPAAGTALGLAIAPELALTLSVVVGASVLALVHWYTGPRLLDLRELPEDEGPRLPASLHLPVWERRFGGDD